MITEKSLHAPHLVRCIITGPSECGKSFFLSNLFLCMFSEFEKIYIYSPSLYQDFYRKLIQGFRNYIPINIIPSILKEGDIDVVNDEIVTDKDFDESDTVIET